MQKQKIIRIGNSLGVTLPSRFLERLSLKVGDKVILNYHTDQSLILEFPDNSQLSLLSVNTDQKEPVR